MELDHVRRIVEAHPDVSFISLQPDNEEALFHLSQIAAENLSVQHDVDPLSSIDDQLDLIAGLDCVCGIDSSALHFSGVMGVPGVVMLGGLATWQWPKRRSFYRSITTVRSSHDFQRAIEGLLASSGPDIVSSSRSR